MVRVLSTMLLWTSPKTAANRETFTPDTSGIGVSIGTFQSSGSIKPLGACPIQRNASQGHELYRQRAQRSEAPAGSGRPWNYSVLTTKLQSPHLGSLGFQ